MTLGSCVCCQDAPRGWKGRGVLAQLEAMRRGYKAAIGGGQRCEGRTKATAATLSAHKNSNPKSSSFGIPGLRGRWAANGLVGRFPRKGRGAGPSPGLCAVAAVPSQAFCSFLQEGS